MPSNCTSKNDVTNALILMFFFFFVPLANYSRKVSKVIKAIKGQKRPLEILQKGSDKITDKHDEKL